MFKHGKTNWTSDVQLAMTIQTYEAMKDSSRCPRHLWKCRPLFVVFVEWLKRVAEAHADLV